MIYGQKFLIVQYDNVSDRDYLSYYHKNQWNIKSGAKGEKNLIEIETTFPVEWNTHAHPKRETIWVRYNLIA